MEAMGYYHTKELQTFMENRIKNGFIYMQNILKSMHFFLHCSFSINIWRPLIFHKLATASLLLGIHWTTVEKPKSTSLFINYTVHYTYYQVVYKVSHCQWTDKLKCESNSTKTTLSNATEFYGKWVQWTILFGEECYQPHLQVMTSSECNIACVCVIPNKQPHLTCVKPPPHDVFQVCPSSLLRLNQ